MLSFCWWYTYSAVLYCTVLYCTGVYSKVRRHKFFLLQVVKGSGKN